MCLICIEYLSKLNIRLNRAVQQEDVKESNKLRGHREDFLNHICNVDCDKAAQLNSQDDPNGTVIDGKTWEERLELWKADGTVTNNENLDDIIKELDGIANSVQDTDITEESETDNQGTLWPEDYDFQSPIGSYHDWKKLREEFLGKEITVNDITKMAEPNTPSTECGHDWTSYQGLFAKEPETVCKKCGKVK